MSEPSSQGEWACVVIYEFDAGPPEQRLIYRGTSHNCERLAEKLERRGINNYFGDPADRTVLQAIAVVCRLDALVAGEYVDATIREPA